MYFAIQQKFEDGYRLEAAELLYQVALSQPFSSIDGSASAQAQQSDALAEIVRALRKLGDNDQLQQHARLSEQSKRADAKFSAAAERFEQLIGEYVLTYQRLLTLTKKRGPPLEKIDLDDWLRLAIGNRPLKNMDPHDLTEYKVGRLCDDMARLTWEAQTITNSYTLLAPLRLIREGLGFNYAKLLYDLEGINQRVIQLRRKLLRLRAVPSSPAHPGYSSVEERIRQDLVQLVHQDTSPTQDIRNPRSRNPDLP